MFAVNYEYPERIVKRKLEISIVQSGVSELLGIVEGAHVYIGREPDDGGITVPNQAVSRNQGVFIRLRNHWFYKDLGSTNGSWINGIPAAEGVWKLIRPGDILQLADAALSIAEAGDGSQPINNITGFPALGGLSLIIFSKGEFLDEFPVPEYGRALVLGGSQGDLQIDGSLDEQPTVVVERRSMNVCAYSVSKSIKVLLNDAELTSSINLNDRDELKVAHYFIIFNDPNPGMRSIDAQRAAHLQSSGQDTGDTQVTSSRVNIKDWGESNVGPDYGNARV